MNNLHEVVFRWPSTDVSDVIVTGTFDQWSSKTHLQRTVAGFEGVVKVPWGQRIQYKFVVDKQWRTLDGHPTEYDSMGNLNNIYVSPPKPVEPPAELPPTVPHDLLPHVNGAPNGHQPEVIEDVEVTKEAAPESADSVEVAPAKAEPVPSADLAPAEQVPLNDHANNIEALPPTVPDVVVGADDVVEPVVSVPSEPTAPPAAQPVSDDTEPSHMPSGPMVVESPSGKGPAEVEAEDAGHPASSPNGVEPSSAEKAAPGPSTTLEDVDKPTPSANGVGPSEQPATPEPAAPTKAVPTTETSAKPVERSAPTVPPAPTTPPPSVPTTPSKKSHHRFPSVGSRRSSSSAGDSPSSAKFNTTPRKKKDSVFKRLSSIFHKDKDKEKSKQENGH